MAAIYDINEVRKNNKLDIDGEPYVVVSVDFRKPGKGTPSTVVKMKHMITGSVIDRTYKSGEKLNGADIEERDMEYLYPEGDHLVFMDKASYEQTSVPTKSIVNDEGEDLRGFLLDNTVCQVLLYNGNPIGVTMPTFITVDVVETEPGFKGDTANNVLKPAKITSGATVQVPIFVNEGDRIKVDTRDGSYVERVAKTR